MSLTGPTAAAVAADPPHTARGLGRAHVTNDPGFLPKQPPGLFASARRRRDLVDGFLHELGGADQLSPVVLMQVRRAAELICASEMLRASLLNGQAVNVHEWLRMEGCASRAIRGLGLRLESRTGPPRGLERARRRWAQQETTKTTKTKAVKASRRGTKPSQRRERPPGHDPTQTDD
jgi:hypothetical protein